MRKEAKKEKYDSKEKCDRCGEPLKNKLFGDKCEDCWAENAGNSEFLSRDYAQVIRERLAKEKHD